MSALLTVERSVAEISRKGAETQRRKKKIEIPDFMFSKSILFQPLLNDNGFSVDLVADLGGVRDGGIRRRSVASGQRVRAAGKKS